MSLEHRVQSEDRKLLVAEIDNVRQERAAIEVENQRVCKQCEIKSESKRLITNLDLVYPRVCACACRLVGARVFVCVCL